MNYHLQLGMMFLTEEQTIKQNKTKQKPSNKYQQQQNYNKYFGVFELCGWS